MTSIPAVLVRLCRKCNSTKSFGEFYDAPGRIFNKASQCISCTLEYNRNRYHNLPGFREAHLAKSKDRLRTDEKYREAHRNYGRKYYESIAGRAKTLFKGILSRQPDATTTLEHIMKLLEIGVCPVTGIAFNLKGGIRSNIRRKHNNPFAPSVDKIVPALGYTDENTRLVIWQYNWMKGELSDDETFMFCYMVVHKRP